jgi:hypothetical protein
MNAVVIFSLSIQILSLITGYVIMAEYRKIRHRRARLFMELSQSDGRMAARQGHVLLWIYGLLLAIFIVGWPLLLFVRS